MVDSEIVDDTELVPLLEADMETDEDGCCWDDALLVALPLGL